jgi:hypothetical protein
VCSLCYFNRTSFSAHAFRPPSQDTVQDGAASAAAAKLETRRRRGRRSPSPVRDRVKPNKTIGARDCRPKGARATGRREHSISWLAGRPAGWVDFSVISVQLTDGGFAAVTPHLREAAPLQWEETTKRANECRRLKRQFFLRTSCRIHASV